VFKNIRILTGIPAGNLLKIMQMGFSRSLGTSCAHCHVAGHWDKDDKTPRQIARDMWKMDHLIVSDLLTNIDGLKDRKPVINCTTCHRGQLKPALNLDADTATR
jgi:Photosynthetic reaction centre cytochrome C subunit